MEEKLLMLPGPTQVPERVLKAMTRPVINHRGELWRELYRKVQKGLKYVFQTENAVYALTNSGTGGVECAISNLVAKGDKVIVPTNGEFGIRISDTVERFGGEAIRVKAEWGDWADPEMIKDALDRNPDTKMIAFVYNETSTGVLNPAKELIKIAKDYDVLVFCDAVSNLAGDYLYTDKWDVDVVVTGSQKCLACPPGLAFISLNEKAEKKVEDNKNRANFYLDLIRLRRFHEKFPEFNISYEKNVDFSLFDVILIIDTNNINQIRLNNNYRIKNLGIPYIFIDHHYIAEKTEQDKPNLIFENYSSTAEIILDLFKLYNTTITTPLKILFLRLIVLQHFVQFYCFHV